MEAKQPTKESSITEEIIEMLKENGNMNRETRDRLMLSAIAELLRRTEGIVKIKEQVEILENRNIVSLFINHPLKSIAVLFIVFALLNLIVESIPVSTLARYFIQLLGFPAPPL
jgi:hypothetical protein